MTARAELIRRAEARGVAVTYGDWRGPLVEVGDETLAAVLNALGGTTLSPGRARPPRTPLAGATPHEGGGPLLLATAAPASWSGSELGAGFVLVNPLHAAEPLAPISPSPYLAMTRRHLSPL